MSTSHSLLSLNTVLSVVPYCAFVEVGTCHSLLTLDTMVSGVPCCAVVEVGTCHSLLSPWCLVYRTVQLWK